MPSRHLLWYALIGELILTMIPGAPVFVFVSPPGLVGRELMPLVFFQTLALAGVILLLVLGMNLVTRRLYCRHFCPLGATLNLVGFRRKVVVAMGHDRCTACGLCDRSCPQELSPANGMAAAPRQRSKQEAQPKNLTDCNP